MIKLMSMICVFVSLLVCGTPPTDDAQSHDETTRKNQSTAKVINLGEKDRPVWVELTFAGNLELHGEKYDHIYGIIHKYIDYTPVHIDTLYYEVAGRESNLINNANFDQIEIIPFPGDKNYKLSIPGRSNDYLAYNVLENDLYARSFKGIPFLNLPTISRSPGEGYRSDFEIEFNITKLENGLYKVIFVGQKDVEEYRYELSCQSKTKPSTTFSFMDRGNGNIHFLEKGCYLKRIKSM